MSKTDRGFASMDRKTQRAIASKGGHAAHAKGVAYRFTKEKAKEAGRKGGLAYHANRKAEKERQRAREEAAIEQVSRPADVASEKVPGV